MTRDEIHFDEPQPKCQVPILGLRVVRLTSRRHVPRFRMGRI